MAETKRARGPAQKAEKAKEEEAETVFVKVAGELYEVPTALSIGEMMHARLAVGKEFDGLLTEGGMGQAFLFAFIAYKRGNQSATWEHFCALGSDEIEFDPEEAKNGSRPTPATSEEPTEQS